MRFSKWHAHGNVYLLAEGDELTPDVVREHVGDADGIVEIADVDGSTATIRIWNADGSLAEMSGNGTRIAARWLADRTGAGRVRISVGGRSLEARMLGGVDVEQDMGEVEVGRRDSAAGIEYVPVSVGNPHAVVEGDPREITRIGPLLETHPRFPNRTNVQVARVDAPGDVAARVWERGVGETASSGSSAVAVAAAFGAPETIVRFPGGALHVRLEGDRAYLTGPAERVAD